MQRVVLSVLLLALPAIAQSGCPDSLEVLDVLSSAGTEYRLYADGRLFTRDNNGACAFSQRYFDPAFLNVNYLVEDGMIYQYTDTRQLFRIGNSIHDDFGSYPRLGDCLMRSLADSGRRWSTVTLQSPMAKSIADYVALRKCIIDGTCDFRDNRIDFVPDPLNSANRCVKFLAMAPTADMVTSKSSIENTVLFFQEDDTLLFEGRYLILSGMPFSLADFENQWFDGSPGPRIVISGGHLAVELKYGSKPMYRQRAGRETDLPVGAWVKVRLQMAFRHDTTAAIRMWQDGKLVLDTLERTLPTRNSLQTNLEFGISATGERTELCIDDIVLECHPATSHIRAEEKAVQRVGSTGTWLSVLSGLNAPRLELSVHLPARSTGALLSLTDVRGRILGRRVIGPAPTGAQRASVDMS